MHCIAGCCYFNFIYRVYSYVFFLHCLSFDLPVEHRKKKIERRKFALGCRPRLCWQKIIITMKEGRKRRRESADDLPVGQEKKVRAHVLPMVQRVK